jgi:hypothetical protein
MSECERKIRLQATHIMRGRSRELFLDVSNPLPAMLGGRLEDSLETSTVSTSLRGRPSRTISRDSTALAALFLLLV